MYVYIYDKWVRDAQYESALTTIETRLIEFGMNGKIERLAVYKDLDAIVTQALKKGAHTIVAVGDDATLRAVIQATWNQPVTLGYIPLKNTPLSKRLRIPLGQEACETLSRRLCKKMTVGRAKNLPVLEDCTFVATPDVWLRCDNQYTIAFKHNAVCRIVHYSDADVEPEKQQQKKWRIEIEPQKKSRFRKTQGMKSTVFARNCMVGTSTTHIPLLIDSLHELNSPCEVALHPEQVTVIVGKYIPEIAA